MKKLPRDLLECAERVMDYHRLSKLDERSRRIVPDPGTRVSPHRVFDYAPDKVPLATRLLDVRTPVLSLLTTGLEAVPESLHTPAQTLQTLSTWLHMAAGLRQRVSFPWGSEHLRPFPSADATFPVEIYAAVFAIEGVAPGLYHYSPREHALRKLRDGPETLSLMRRGRPDLHFLATVPAALLISTVFCRAGWTQGRRGYRQALVEAGHLIANCHATATGLGISTQARLRMSDACMRELIGLPEDFDYISAEQVQAMVIWADEAVAPMNTLQRNSLQTLELLPRPHRGECLSYGSVLAVHHDILARGVVGRDVRPPLTELTPLPSAVKMDAVARVEADVASRPLRDVLLNTLAPVSTFDQKPLSRDLLAEISVAAFRGGTYFPLKPDGPHLGLVRPFWVLQNVSGHERGIWWYDPVGDQWAMLNIGDYNRQSAYMTRQNDALHQAAAVCVVVANLRTLLAEAGPDLYRLAHLEAGIAAQRMNLAAASLGLGCQIHGEFFDEQWRQFLGLSTTGWEPLLVAAIGTLPPPTTSAVAAGTSAEAVRDDSSFKLRD